METKRQKRETLAKIMTTLVRSNGGGWKKVAKKKRDSSISTEQQRRKRDTLRIVFKARGFVKEKKTAKREG